MKILNSKFQISKKSLPREAKRSGGFTVLESIVAIMILSLSISGAFSAVGQSLSQAVIAKDEVKAFYLAQEAVEIIRNKRDTNQLIKLNTGGGDWLDGITNALNCPFDKVCRADATTNPPSLTYCGDNWDSCDNLKQDSTTYLYGYNSGDLTSFKREIQIERVQNDILGNPIEIAVTVRISWTKGSLPPFVFKVKTYLFNWI